MKFTKVVKAERDLSIEINAQKEYIDGQIEELKARLNKMLSNETISDSQKLEVLNNTVTKLTNALFPLNYFKS